MTDNKMRKAIIKFGDENPSLDLDFRLHTHGKYLTQEKAIVAARAFKAGATWQAAQSEQAVPAADEPRTLMTDDEAKAWAWRTLKADLEPRNWAPGESGSFYGFFNWGWVYRAQYEKQKPQQSVPVVGEVVAWRYKPGQFVEGGSIGHLDRMHGAVCRGYEVEQLVVQPTHSISAAELERLKHCRELLKEARDDVAETLNCMRASYRDSPRNKTRLDKQLEFLKQIDAAIAAEGEK